MSFLDIVLPLGKSAKKIDIPFDFILSAVGTFGLYQDKIHPLLHILAVVFAVPTACRVIPFIDFLPPAVEDTCLELHNRLVAVFGLVDVVDTVAVGRESVGHIEFALADGDGNRPYLVPIFLGVGNGVLSVHKGGIQHYLVGARLGEGVFGVLFIPCQVGLAFAQQREALFIVRGVVADV